MTVAAVGAVAALGLAGCGGGEVTGSAAPVRGSGASPAGTAAGGPAGTATGSAGTAAGRSAGTAAAADAPVGSAAGSGPLSGTRYGIVTAVDPGRSAVTVNVVDWFPADAAPRACAEDGVAPSGAWCVQYYYRDTNPLLRTLPVAGRAAISVLRSTDTGPADGPGTLADVRAGLDLVHIYRLRVAGGTVTGMTPVYVP
jgi:hypothetical protein